MCPKLDSELLEEKRLEAFKTSFLAKMKLQKVPENPTETITSLRAFDRDTQKSYEDAVNALSDSYSGVCSKCPHCSKPGNTEDYYAEVFRDVKGDVGDNGRNAEFRLEKKTRNGHMKQARLRIPIESSQQFEHYSRQQRDTSDMQVKIYLKEYGPQNQTLSRRLVHEQKYRVDSDTVTIDVTSLLEEYRDAADGQDEDHSLALEADFETSMDIAISPQETRMTVISEVDSEGGRSKRQSDAINSDYCRETPQERRCCLRDLAVNFYKLGWKWVQWPPELNIHYCSGTCPYTWPNSAERYPTVLRAYRQLNPTSAPEPCCSAQRIRGITAIVKKDPQKTAEVINLSDMIIESCICG